MPSIFELKKLNNSLQLWITNISKIHLKIGDLRIKIPAGAQRNLLSPELGLTQKAIADSWNTGSMSTLRDKLRLGQVKKPANFTKFEVSELPALPRVRIGILTKQEKFSERLLTDEEIEEDTQFMDEFVSQNPDD